MKPDKYERPTEKKCSKCGKTRSLCFFDLGDVCEDCQVESIIRYNGYTGNLKLMSTPDMPNDKNRN